MKKKLLITIFLLLQSFSSFGSPNGKGIVCNWIDGNVELYKKRFRTLISNIPTDVGYFFENDKVVISEFRIKNDIVFVENDVDERYRFSSTINEIEWGSSVNWRYKLDRKTLTLKEIMFTQVVTKRKCEVLSKTDFNERIKNLKKQYQKNYDLKLKGNKI